MSFSGASSPVTKEARFSSITWVLSCLWSQQYLALGMEVQACVSAFQCYLGGGALCGIAACMDNQL